MSMKKPYYVFGGPKMIRRNELIEYLKKESKRVETACRGVYQTGDREMAARMNGRMCGLDDLVELLKNTYGKV